MTQSVGAILGVLSEYGIEPGEEAVTGVRDVNRVRRDIGEILESESVYATSVDTVTETLGLEAAAADGRLREWVEEVESMLRLAPDERMVRRKQSQEWQDPPEPHCAWYAPIHFFGCQWPLGSPHL